MKSFVVAPSKLRGSIAIPSSKSHTMRAILFGALAKGKTTISNFLSSSDTSHMIHACKMLGAHCEISDHLMIEGVGCQILPIEDVIQAGNSGIILRFLTAIAALSPAYTVITGDHSIRNQRPMDKMMHALHQLNVLAVSSRGNGCAPLIIKGPLKGGKATLSGEDSQPVSSLLIGCSLAEGATELTILNPGEKPWVQLTLSWFDRLGIPYKNENFEKFWIQGNSRFEGFNYSVPGDWSSAAFPIGAALITQSSLTIENVDLSDPQGDKEILTPLKTMGAQFEINPERKTVKVKQGEKLKGIVIDVNPFIDALPILAVIACFAEGETHLINASIARTKECDRLHCMATELKKMGADILETEDSLIIRGKELRGAQLNSHGDHRIALSLTVAAMGAEGDSTIQNIECANKTFPRFIESFQALGATIQ